MLKYINYQLNTDEQAQSILEQTAAKNIKHCLQDNIAAFSHYMPSVVPLIEQHSMQQYSVFCNKSGELNIVDFATGRVWYGPTPSTEVRNEVELFCNAAPFFELDAADLPFPSNVWPIDPSPKQIDVLVMFGLGLGHQLSTLLQSVSIKYLIIYEPNVDTLVCSLQSNNWRKIFEVAENMGCHIFLQLDNDGSTVAEDLTELSEAAVFNRVYVYRHYFHPVMDQVILHLMRHRGDKQELLSSSQQFLPFDEVQDYVAERAGNNLGNIVSGSKIHAKPLYEKNLAALKKYYPKVHEAIIKHQPKHWQLVKDIAGKPNLYHGERRAFFYQDIWDESAQLVTYFTQNPYKDDVLLGQTSVDKFQHYIHYSHIAKTQPLISKQLKQKIHLPEEVDSLLLFGVALGKHIELLTAKYKIKNFYICEPNLDFFAASLRVTDWSAIFEQAEKNGHRIYLNLGGDGSTYFYDLMAQFYQVGAYSIANTYMFSAYYNHKMHQAIANLRAELKVVLALGEYYDHCRYGIAHTHNSLVCGHKFLKQDNQHFRQLAALELPVFIVGNGPSLDSSFEYILQHREQVIVISCGTALYSLYKKGITPDFHAEVEQNRSTYCWISQVKDKAYLKKIRLISVNGIHPETADLFCDTLLCFKDGESSTNFFDRGLRRRDIHVASLSYAYPTVTNLVLNYALRVGFKVFYLFGVDLGYADVRYHHSQASAYYRKDGTEVYDYQQTHGGGLPAIGNFQPLVFTKPEFDMSRKLLEQAIEKAGRKVEVYNCSNGVRIKGAVPLKPENILFTDVPKNKKQLLTELIAQAFFDDLREQGSAIYGEIDFDLFRQTKQEWLALFDMDINTQEQAKNFVSEQWRLLQRKARKAGDPTFFLFYGSTNYFGGLMTKVAACISNEDEEFLRVFHQVLQVWRDYVVSACDAFLLQPLKFDDVDVGHLFSK